MPRSDVPPLAQADVSLTVRQADLASTAGEPTGDSFPPVFATARMVSIMETAAARCLMPLLEQGELSVGVGVDVKHTAATPLGGRVTAHARWLGVEGKLQRFEVWAEDDAGEVGRGQHTRAIVNAERIVAGAAKRAR